MNSVSKEAQMHSVSKILFNSFLILFFSCSSSEKDQEIILIASSLSIDSYIKEYKSGKLELCIDHIVFGMNWDLEKKIYKGLDNKKIKFSKKEYINQMDKIFFEYYLSTFKCNVLKDKNNIAFKIIDDALILYEEKKQFLDEKYLKKIIDEIKYYSERPFILPGEFQY